MGPRRYGESTETIAKIVGSSLYFEEFRFECNKEGENGWLVHSNLNSLETSPEDQSIQVIIKSIKKTNPGCRYFTIDKFWTNNCFIRASVVIEENKMPAIKISIVDSSDLQEVNLIKQKYGPEAIGISRSDAEAAIKAVEKRQAPAILEVIKKERQFTEDYIKKLDKDAKYYENLLNS